MIGTELQWLGGIGVIVLAIAHGLATPSTGGCAGSTGGGMKVIRFVVIVQQAGVHIRSLIHPRLVLIVAMLVGRLEVFTPLVLLTPASWDR